MADLRVGPGKTYANYADAYAAGSNGDTILSWLPFCIQTAALYGKSISVVGMLPNRRCVVQCIGCVFYYDQGALAGKVTISNMTLFGMTNGYPVVYYGDTGSLADGMLVDQCAIYGGDQGVWAHMGAALSVTVRNSLIVNSGYCLSLGISTNVYNCTLARNSYGVVGNNLAHVIKNTFSLESRYSPFAGCGNATGSNNISDDAGQPAPGTGPAVVTRTNALLMIGLQGGTENDFRPIPTSPLVGAGVAITGVTLDYQGKARPNPPSIGCSEVPDFLEALCAADKILTGNSVTSVFGATTNGSATTADPNDVLTSAGGNATLPAANVVLSTAPAYGNPTAQVTPTFNLAAAEAAYEAGRNNDNGTVAADIATGKSVKIRNVTTTGTRVPADPDTVVKSAGGHWNDDNIKSQADATLNVKILVPVGLAWTGGLSSSGGTITPAKVAAEDDRNGTSATFTVYDSPSAYSINQVYVGRFLSSGPQSWTLVGTTTGNGSFTATLANTTEYQVKVQTTDGGVGIYVGNTFWITNVTSRRRALLRDRTAFAAMRVARRLGRRVWYRNLGYTAVEVWATCEGGFESLSLLGGETSQTRFTLWIPRQTGMPTTEGFRTGGTIWVEDIPYACSISYDAELPEWAPVFKADCTRYDLTVEIDGLEVPSNAP